MSKEAEKYFKKVYCFNPEVIPVKEVIEIMQSFADEQVKKELLTSYPINELVADMLEEIEKSLNMKMDGAPTLQIGMKMQSDKIQEVINKLRQ